MLVLSRHVDESLIIGNDIEIVVVEIRGDKVRLGVQAPREISVHRKEVYDAIQREREANRPPQQYFDAISRSPAAESDGNSLDTTEHKE